MKKYILSGIAVGAIIDVILLASLGCFGLSVSGSVCPTGFDLFIFNLKTMPVTLHAAILIAGAIAGGLLGLIIKKVTAARL